MIQLILSILLFTTTSFNSKVNTFEGSINIVKRNFYNTFYYTYRVKSPYVRIDEYDSNERILNSLLINIEKETLIVFNT
ncbi:MAG: hypothetical protein PF487_03100 [Bacteroidales bacterium]|jgi:hypothetical protein|nr:hypothetical protein [Bacteroidales bacterium]